jgi:hypothetical protein
MLFLVSTSIIFNETNGKFLRDFNCYRATSCVMARCVSVSGNFIWIGTPNASRRVTGNVPTCTSSPSSPLHSLTYNSFKWPRLRITYRSGNGSPFTFSTASPLQKGEARRRFKAESVILGQWLMSKERTLAILSQLAKKIRKLSPIAIPLRDKAAAFIFDFSMIMDNYSSFTMYLGWKRMPMRLALPNWLTKASSNVFS